MLGGGDTGEANVSFPELKDIDLTNGVYGIVEFAPNGLIILSLRNTPSRNP